MDRLIVKSSTIFSVGYENGVLEVEFTTGGIYAYQDVPPEIFHELTVARSVGEYFHKKIKNVYPYSRIL